MVARTYFDKQETAARNDARSTNKKTGRYQFEPFKDDEVVKERPINCFKCSWERLPNNGGFRLKFKHKNCYPDHIRTETEVPS